MNWSLQETEKDPQGATLLQLSSDKSRSALDVCLPYIHLDVWLSPMSLSQQAIFLYTSSHAVTVIASMILGMKRASRGISLIPITNSCRDTTAAFYSTLQRGKKQHPGCVGSFVHPWTNKQGEGVLQKQMLMENIKPNLMESIWMLENYQIEYFITPVQKSVQLSKNQSFLA